MKSHIFNHTGYTMLQKCIQATQDTGIILLRKYALEMMDKCGFTSSNRWLAEKVVK